MNYLPNKLLKLRKHYNYSQSYLADTLGVDTLDYMNYENGSDMISYAQMKKLSSLYHIDLVEIFLNNEDVTLYDVSNVNTDEINIEYFIGKKNFKDKIIDFYSNNKISTTIIAALLLTILILTIVLKNTVKPYTLKKENINRLSVSEYTVIYIDDYYSVNGSGSNANGELSNLISSGAIKVCEGEGFSIILNEDGTVSSAGLISKYAKEVDNWRNIIDVAAGDNHVLGVDSNGRVYCVGEDDGSCQVSELRNIKKVFATKKGSIVLDNYGELSYSGTFIGSSSIKNYYNVKDIASSNNILAILCEDNTIDVYSKNSTNYFEAERWRDIVDVACGDSYVAGLDEYGKVHIEIDNEEIRNEIEKWSNIIAIDGASDYLIGFDGINIFGVGNNNYGQFIKEELVKQRLEKVSEVEYNIDDHYVSVQFNGVNNASSYIVSIDIGIGISRRINSDEEIVKFETDNMTEGKAYNITIVAVGEGDYIDSDEYKLSFTYNKPEESFSFEEGINYVEEEFINYLIDLGVDKERIVGSQAEEDDICGSDVVTISNTNLDGKTFKKSELLNMNIEYTYCRIIDDDKE